jgi:5'-methylthioadenosine phosphorylase
MTTSATQPVLGIIGGSGVYDIDGLQNAEWKTIETPFGAPSDDLLFGTLAGQPLVFLPRHGRGHVHSPTTVPFQANIDALKRAGCTHVLAINAVGSLKEELPPGAFVLVDQYIDRTYAREKSFFTKGCVAHVAFGAPTCAELGDKVAEAVQEDADIPFQKGGTLIVIEGPQFSTRAESNLYRSWGCDVIGMTNMPEAKLAREAELCYTTLAMVTDYDCWHDGHDDVTVEQVIKILTGNAEKARGVVQRLAPKMAGLSMPCPEGCHTALENALITHPNKRDASLLSKLDAIAGKYLA